MKFRTYEAIADFYLKGFREVKKGETVTMAEQVVRDYDLEDKLLVKKGG